MTILAIILAFIIGYLLPRAKNEVTSDIQHLQEEVKTIKQSVFPSQLKVLHKKDVITHSEQVIEDLNKDNDL